MPSNDEVLNVGVNLEVREALKSLNQFERNMAKALQGVSRAMGKLGQQSAKVTKKATSDWDSVSKSMKGTSGGSKMPPLFDKKALGRDLKVAVAGAGKEFGAALSAAVGKDLKGALADALKGAKVGSGGGGVGGGGGRRGGGGGGGGGGEKKHMSGMAKGMGGAMKTLSKMGPMLGGLATIVAKIATFFLGLDQEMKDFNKSILEGSGNIGFMATNADNAESAFADMKSTVEGVREAAYDLQNLDWGISKKDHVAMISSLQQEGIELSRIAEEAKKAGEPIAKFAAELTQMGVAYSRTFGVPLAQIGELQGQMMSELGMGATDARDAFKVMTRAAQESGIAGNKFFAQIRGVSQDFSLFNNRMDDSVKMLGMLNKVMNPRNAAKFMSSSMNALKGMGRQQKIQVALLTNPGKIIEKDQKRRVKNLAKMLKMDATNVAKILNTEGTKGLEGAIGNLEKSKQGAAREFALETEMQGKVKKKGLVGQAMAMGSLGGGAQAELIAKAATSLSGGGGNLTDAIGNLGVEMTADMLGISHEQLRDSAKLQYAVNQQKDELKAQLAKGGSERLKALAALEKANLKESELDSANWDEVIATFSENKKSKMEDEGLSKAEQLSKKQGDLTQSVLDKMGILVDFLKNQIYSVLTGIWEAGMTAAKLMNLGGETDQEKMKKLENKINNMAEGDSKKVLQKALEDSAGMMSGERLSRVSGIATGQFAMDTANAQKKADNQAFGLDKIFADAAAAGKPLSEGEMVGAQLKAIFESNIGETGKEFGLDPASIATMESIQMELNNLAEGGQMTEKGFAGEDIVAHYGPLMEKLMEPWTKAKAAASKAGVTPGGMQVGTPGGGGGLPKGLKLLGEENNKYSDLSKDEQEDMWRNDMEAGGGGMKGAEKASATRRRREATDKIWADTLPAMMQTSEAAAGDNKALLTLFSQPQTAYVKFSSNFLKGPYKKVIYESVIKAVRTALVEYYMLQQLDQDEVAEHLKERGGGLAALMEAIGKGVALGKTTKEITGLDTKNDSKKERKQRDGESPEDYSKRMRALDDNAAGGMVTSIAGGIANVRAAAGEGLASVGVGETISSRGKSGSGSGGSVHITLSPDAARLIRAEAQNQIYAHEGRKRR